MLQAIYTWQLYIYNIPVIIVVVIAVVSVLDVVVGTLKLTSAKQRCMQFCDKYATADMQYLISGTP